MNLRAQAVKDLKKTLEGKFGLPVTLTAPDGSIINTDEDGATLKGQVLYDSVRMDLDTGDAVVNTDPKVVLRRASLSKIPEAGENWIVEIPSDPDQVATELFKLNDSRPPEHRKTLGIITLFLQKVEQS